MNHFEIIAIGVPSASYEEPNQSTSRLPLSFVWVQRETAVQQPLRSNPTTLLVKALCFIAAKQIEGEI